MSTKRAAFSFKPSLEALANRITPSHHKSIPTLNPEVAAKTTALPVAVGPRDGMATLSSAGEGGDSNSSLVRRGEGTRWEIEQVTMPTLLARSGLEGADFVKIDIEGSEYELTYSILGKPTLFVSMHPNLLVDKRSLASTIVSGLGALRANRRFLRATLVYRHHYVYDEARRSFRDIRRRNVTRVIFPVPLRASFLIGACLFTDESI